LKFCTGELESWCAAGSQKKNNRIYRKFLKPGDAPEAEFEINSGDILAAD